MNNKAYKTLLERYEQNKEDFKSFKKIVYYPLSSLVCLSPLALNLLVQQVDAQFLKENIKLQETLNYIILLFGGLWGCAESLNYGYIFMIFNKVYQEKEKENKNLNQKLESRKSQLNSFQSALIKRNQQQQIQKQILINHSFGSDMESSDDQSGYLLANDAMYLDM
ncbi:hypothetical protein PPERSA_10655 [Pseudocohnilembus persalinus]|uniref:Transmembrane protein n=1 Tax=Pseudocohnilembus persalinus TaxID=266149 RepID=A0A0V0QD86_PSEPJ|nr:hypothetical protein PPERSA_10655 [Pseudocohnilembus persalinus]|eukprot:KRX00156.1 hypothetical protein PPERSA_10655 [Pseudocohnilembus persalinus]